MAVCADGNKSVVYLNLSQVGRFSSAKYYGADKGAVITNAGYTESAKQLAASTGVRLLSPEDIPTLQP